MKNLRDCNTCGANPGKAHWEGCSVERCSVCGGQRIACDCDGHDPAFSRWTGVYPGEAEATTLGIDLNEFHAKGLNEVFFVKPSEVRP